MKTSLTSQILDTAAGQRANTILRKCVHCGFCNATCPTYQITGDELDGPRGRIYQIKQMLEGDAVTEQTQLHLDRCLTCRNCETTCPSGVDYARLLDTGRHMVEQRLQRAPAQRLQRRVLRKFLLSPWFGIALKLGRAIRPFSFGALKRAIPERNPLPKPATATSTTDRKALLITGCVQKSLQPSIDAAAQQVLQRCGVEVVTTSSASCCGAINHHLGADSEALAQVRSNIDHWLQQMQQHGIEHITMTASGCGVMIQDYPHLLADDPAYLEKAERISKAYLDPVELIEQRATSLPRSNGERIAFHPPCTQQHGSKITGKVEALLESLGYQLANFDESHLCCGSAGTYSITQKKLSRELRDRKLNHLGASRASIIATANIGCQTHLQSGTNTPVRHWLELLANQPAQ